MSQWHGFLPIDVVLLSLLVVQVCSNGIASHGSWLCGLDQIICSNFSHQAITLWSSGFDLAWSLILAAAGSWWQDASARCVRVGQNQNTCALICQISHVCEMFDHVIRVFGYWWMHDQFSKVKIGCQGKRSKSWYGGHEYENNLTFLEMKKQGKTQLTWLLDDESRQSRLD